MSDSKPPVGGRPHSPPNQQSMAALLERAAALHRQGRNADAEILYRAVLAQDPMQFDALHLLGFAHYQKGEHVVAAELIDRAIGMNPSVSAAHSNRGLVMQALKRPEDALVSYDRALRLRPDNAEAHNNRGNVLLDLKRPEEALASFDRALQLKPDYADALNNRGNALRALKRPDEALVNFDRALEHNPNDANVVMNRGNALLELRRPDEAVVSYERALLIEPDNSGVLNSLGSVLLELDRPGEALACFDRALRLKRGDTEQVLRNRGLALFALKRYRESADAFADLLAVSPDYDYALGFKLHVQLHCCDWSDFDAAASDIVAGVERGEKRDAPFPFLVHSLHAADQLNCARIFVADKYPSDANAVWSGPNYWHDRIRVAYLSADFHDHATAYLAAGLFENHDRRRFEISAISFGPDDTGPMRERLRRAFHRFIDVRRSSDREVAQLLRQLEIDIAVDLKGFTKGDRPGIFACRGAPLQVSYLGFPGTMGADFIDYVIADRLVIPPHHDRFYAEKVVRLPNSYQVNDRTRPIAERTPSRADLRLPDNGFVFCCFNNNYKLTPAVFGVWMRLLKRIDGSVLWLLEDNAEASRNLAQHAEQRGVSPNRLVFAPRKQPDAHLARQRSADLFLDTFPCNAHTTASDALWAGLPLITCMGDTFASRVAGSLLHAAGMPELITEDLNDYEALASELATGPGMLAGVKAKLARNRDTFPLFDTDCFRRHIEAAYTTMYERHQRGERPAAFDVPQTEL